VDPESRDLRRELTNALRRCTPKQRKWLGVVREMAGQKWRAAVKLNYSTNSVRKWLRQERVQTVLILQAEMAELDNDLTAARIQHEYGRLAFSSLKEFYKPDNTFKQPSEWTEDMAASVSELRFDEKGGIAAIKLHSKPRALDTTAKIRGVLVEKLKHEHGELRIRDVSDEPLSSEEWERQYGMEAPAGPAKGVN
jgi:hypothetical protein